MDSMILWAEATLLIALAGKNNRKINRALTIIDELHVRILLAGDR